MQEELRRVLFILLGQRQSFVAFLLTRRKIQLIITYEHMLICYY
jgi:hypothetical protein